jgi:hypothetical protein
LSSGSDALPMSSSGSPDHVSTLSGPGTSPYPASYAGRPGEEPAIMSRFPAAFRLPAFASWSSIARWGAGPSLRSAYRASSLEPGPQRGYYVPHVRVATGGGCPLYPGDSGAPTADCPSPAAACHISTAKSLYPGPAPITRGSS